jgi:hypothetical protein
VGRGEHSLGRAAAPFIHKARGHGRGRGKGEAVAQRRDTEQTGSPLDIAASSRIQAPQSLLWLLQMSTLCSARTVTGLDRA